MVRLRVATAALLVALLGAGWLQGQPDEKKNDEKPTRLRGTLPAFYKKLGLRDDQVQEIYRIQTKNRAKAEDLRRQLKELRDKERAATEKVLTPEQLKRLRELRTGEKSTSPPVDKGKPIEKPKGP